jgi:hypothetical protein
LTATTDIPDAVGLAVPYSRSSSGGRRRGLFAGILDGCLTDESESATVAPDRAGRVAAVVGHASSMKHDSRLRTPHPAGVAYGSDQENDDCQQEARNPKERSEYEKRSREAKR